MYWDYHHLILFLSFFLVSDSSLLCFSLLLFNIDLYNSQQHLSFPPVEKHRVLRDRYGMWDSADQGAIISFTCPWMLDSNLWASFSSSTNNEQQNQISLCKCRAKDEAPCVLTLTVLTTAMFTTSVVVLQGTGGEPTTLPPSSSWWESKN